MEDIIVSQAMLDAGALALLRAEASDTDGETMLREIYLAMVKAGEERRGMARNGTEWCGEARIGEAGEDRRGKAWTGAE